jgi:hypothetical protein
MFNAPFLHKSFGPKKQGQILLLLPDHSRNVYLISDPTIISGSWVSIKSKIDAKGIKPIARYQEDEHGFYSWEPLKTQSMTALDVANLSSACYKLFKLDHAIEDPFLQKAEVIKEILRFFGETFVRSIRHSVEPDPTVYALPEADNVEDTSTDNENDPLGLGYTIEPVNWDIWCKADLTEVLAFHGIPSPNKVNKAVLVAMVEDLIA